METSRLAESPHQQPEDGVDAVVVRDLVKTYGSLRAVDGLSFTVQRGQIFALLGPNGAGKTTTVEILEGYRRADSGEVRVLGYHPIAQGHQMKEQMGLMLQQTALYQQIRVKEALTLFCSYYPHPREPRALAELVGLGDKLSASFEDLSGGQKQRLSLALALAGNPRLVFLDEPTAAMDPQMRLQTWDIITDLRNQGVTLLMTTHYMEEAQRLADRVAIVDHGKLVALGTPEQLTSVSATEIVTFSGPEGIPPDELRRLPAVKGATENRPGAYTITTDDALNLVAALAAWRDRAQMEISGLRVTGATLEDVFLQMTGDEVRD
jgi:ABC-2 type transport system ATP-binding protein